MKRMSRSAPLTCRKTPLDLSRFRRALVQRLFLGRRGRARPRGTGNVQIGDPRTGRRGQPAADPHETALPHDISGDLRRKVDDGDPAPQPLPAETLQDLPAKGRLPRVDIADDQRFLAEIISTVHGRSSSQRLQAKSGSEEERKSRNSRILLLPFITLFLTSALLHLAIGRAAGFLPGRPPECLGQEKQRKRPIT